MTPETPRYEITAHRFADSGDRLRAGGQLILDVFYAAEPSLYADVDAYFNAPEASADDVLYLVTDQTDGSAIAAATVSHRTEVPGASFLDDIAVRQDRQRQGVGRLLVRHVAATAQEQGDYSLRTDAVINADFFERLGFPAENVDGMLEAPVDVILEH